MKYIKYMKYMTIMVREREKKKIMVRDYKARMSPLTTFTQPCTAIPS